MFRTSGVARAKVVRYGLLLGGACFRALLIGWGEANVFTRSALFFSKMGDV